MTAPRMQAQDWVALLVLSVLWGGTFLFAKIALADIPPFTLVAARVLIAALVLYIVMRATGLSFAGAGVSLAGFAGMGLLNNAIPFSLIFLGQQHVSAGLAAILNAATPIFTVLVLHYATQDEKATPRKVVGVALGIFGVVLVIGADALAGLGTQVFAQLAILGATLSYAFALLWGRRHFRGTPPLVGAAGQLVASSLMTTPLALVVDQPWRLPAPSWQAAAALVAMATFSTALAYILYFRIMARAGGVNAALVTLLIPPSTILLGALVLGERLDPWDGIGLAVLIAGLLVVDGRLVDKTRAALGPSAGQR
jgi:drug/metabolite transporter (DMT)-like permease